MSIKKRKVSPQLKEMGKRPRDMNEELGGDKGNGGRGNTEPRPVMERNFGSYHSKFCSALLCSALLCFALLCFALGSKKFVAVCEPR